MKSRALFEQIHWYSSKWHIVHLECRRSVCCDFTLITYLDCDAVGVSCGGAVVVVGHQGSAPGELPSCGAEDEVREVPLVHHLSGDRAADSKAAVVVLHPGGTGSDSDYQMAPCAVLGKH